MANDDRESVADSHASSYNTIKRQPRSTLKYSTRMTLSFALTAVLSAVVLSAVLAFVWEDQFQSYTRANMQRMVEQTAETLAQQYGEHKAWTNETLEFMASTSESMPEVGMRLANDEGEVLYDDDSGGAIAVTRTGKQRRIIMPLDENSIVTADIMVEGEEGRVSFVAGTLTFWSASSDALLTKSDSVFRTNSYAAIITAASLAVVFACVIGYFVARALTKPIKRITTTASQIRNGDLTARTGLSGTDEIGRLGETFDDMASSLEHDIKFEHRLTSDVAHELRTPLMAMQATVEAMQDGVMPADQNNLATVSVEVRRLSRLVDAMLRLSRMENGTTPLNIERCDVVALVEDLVTVHSQLFQDNGIELIYQNETGHREFYAELDPDLIREAMVNLLSNAMRYTAEGGNVWVKVARNRRNVLLSVQDTGMGIAKEDMPRVFSRFWRSDASRERVAGGLGVGLALTKEIVDRHNGTIAVDSEEGVGTTFTLRLPITQRKQK
ncbi:MAG: HAMP domain-containing sensor histidine kinase [Coriobacteriales bacterium]|nr:HAMP domain-containing sensor histidine kinase [Coriobacteriales bacterium]